MKNYFNNIKYRKILMMQMLGLCMSVSLFRQDNNNNFIEDNSIIGTLFGDDYRCTHMMEQVEKENYYVYEKEIKLYTKNTQAVKNSIKNGLDVKELKVIYNGLNNTYQILDDIPNEDYISEYDYEIVYEINTVIQILSKKDIEGFKKCGKYIPNVNDKSIVCIIDNKVVLATYEEASSINIDDRCEMIHILDDEIYEKYEKELSNKYDFLANKYEYQGKQEKTDYSKVLINKNNINR